MSEAGLHEGYGKAIDPWHDSAAKLQELGRSGLKSVMLSEDGVPGESSRSLSWQDYALCSQTDQEAFFPEKGGSTREAKKVCVNCEVRQDCLDYALSNNERFGIWGGKSERERRKLKKTLDN